MQSKLFTNNILRRAFNLRLCGLDVALISIPQGDIDSRTCKTLCSCRFCWVFADMFSVVLLARPQLKVRDRFTLRVFESRSRHFSLLLRSFDDRTVLRDGIYNLLRIQFGRFLKVALQWSDLQIALSRDRSKHAEGLQVLTLSRDVVHLRLFCFHFCLQNVRSIGLSYIGKLMHRLRGVKRYTKQPLPQLDCCLGRERSVERLFDISVDTVGLLFNSYLVCYFFLIVDIAP